MRFGWFALFVAGCAGEASPSTAPVRTCGAAELPDPAGGCLAVGVPSDGCAAGFTHDGDGGCAAVLPEASCPAGELAVPGDKTCHSVSPCTGRFGTAKDAPDTVYVDAALPDGDGSRDRPFATIQRAIDAAREGATVAIAAGRYAESIHIKKRVVLHGACASKVEIAGSGEFASVDVAATAELYDLGVSGSGFGVVVTNAKDVVLERVHVHDTRVGGVYVANGGPGASATLRASLVERATGAGATAGSGVLAIERSLIRDTRADTRKDWGYGVRAERFGPVDKPSEQPASVTIVQSVIERNKTGGVLAQGSSVVLEGSVVRDIEPRPRDGLGGEGVIGLYFRSSPEVRVVQSLITRTRTAGLAMYGGKLTVDRTTVLAIEANGAGALGMGVLARPDIDAVAPPQLSLEASRITSVRHVGVLMQGATGTIARTIVRDIASNDGYGDGLGIGGFLRAGAITEASAEVHDVIVSGAARAAIIVAGASLSLARARLACNEIDLDVEPFVAKDVPHAFALEDRGGNLCGCEQLGACTAHTKSIEPASAP